MYTFTPTATQRLFRSPSAVCYKVQLQDGITVLHQFLSCLFLFSYLSCLFSQFGTDFQLSTADVWPYIWKNKSTTRTTPTGRQKYSSFINGHPTRGRTCPLRRCGVVGY
jgi:hypothetical protein